MKSKKSARRPDIYKELRQLTEVQGTLVETYEGSLHEQAHDSRLFEHVKRKHDLSRQIHNASEQEQETLQAQIDEINDLLRNAYPTEREKAEAILDIQRNFNELKQMGFKKTDPVGMYLINAVTSHSSLSTEESSAPFSGYVNNTSESWAYATDKQIQEFLNSREFFDTSYVHDDTAGYGVYITSDPGDEIEIPAEIFVYARGFSSWSGRNDGKGAKFNVESQSPSTSSDVIKYYASKPSELPPVSHVQIYVQPNGKIFADNDGGDSHRLVAAILRGKKQILAKSVSIKVLSKNII